MKILVTEGANFIDSTVVRWYGRYLAGLLSEG